MRTLGNVLLLIAAAGFIAFPICYHVTTRGVWRRSTMGVHLMTFMAVFAEVMCFAVANFVWVLPTWVRPLIWLEIGAVVWWRIALLFTLQARRDRRDTPRPRR